jgi:hypothetical protein
MVSDGLSGSECKHRRTDAKPTVILHVKGCWSVVILYPGTIVQKSVQNRNKKKSAGLSFPGSHMRSVIRAKNANHWTKKSSFNSPDAANILAHLAGISTLKLAQPGAPLDLEENLLPRRADNLNPTSTLASRPSRAKNCECEGVKRQRQYLDIDRRVCILRLDLGGVLGVWLLLLLVVRHCQFQARVG